MLSRLVTAALFASLCVAQANATILIALRVPGRVVIGTDGMERAVVAGKNSASCKLFVGTTMAIATGGLTSVDDARTGRAAYNLDEVARRVATSGVSLRAALDALRKETTPIAEGVPVAIKNTKPKEYRTLLMRTEGGLEYGRFAGFLLAGLVDGEPAMARLMFDFSLPVGPPDLSRWATVVIDEKICPGDCPPVGVPFTMGIDNAVPSALKATNQKDPAAVVDFLLKAQSTLTPTLVGPPFAIAEVADGKVALVTKSAACAGQQRPPL